MIGHLAMTFSDVYFSEASEIIEKIDKNAVEDLVEQISALKVSGGRLFFLGVGGSAGNCGHAVNDFRKLVGIESYAPTDNVSELTARTNDEGWDTVFVEWLRLSKLSSNDALFIFSVGGGNEERNVSTNLISAIKFADQVDAKVFGIVGKADGYTARNGTQVIVVPAVNDDRITPHSEAFQAVIWHLIVSHPSLTPNKTKW